MDSSIECIERKAAINVVNTWIGQPDTVLRTVLIHKDMNAIPAADGAPVVRGRWLRREVLPDMAECKCSSCGHTDYPHRNDIYWFKRNFCPICGAKMEVQDG